jgi:hypothetical protein
MIIRKGMAIQVPVLWTHSIVSSIHPFELADAHCLMPFRSHLPEDRSCLIDCDKLRTIPRHSDSFIQFLPNVA